MTDIRKTIKRLEELEAKASSGPWFDGYVLYPENITLADAALIVTMRNALPELLRELQRLEDRAKKAEAERDQTKAQSEDNLMKCPCDTEYDDDHDCEFHMVVRLDRDKWKARAEALEQAVKAGDSLCEFCIHDGKPANWPPCVGCDRDGVGGWEFNEARFKK